MKKTFYPFVLFAAVVAMVSCTRDEVRGGIAPVLEGELMNLKVGVSTLLTRADGDSESVTDEADSTVASLPSEAKINSLQVFVFSAGENGGLEKSAYDSTGAEFVELSCFAGNKEVVAVVNAPEEINWLSIDSVEDLNGQVTKLKDNWDGNFFMYGSVPANVPEDEEVVIKVERRVARVVLNSVTNMVTPDSAVGELILKAAYLVNVSGDAQYYGSSGLEVWYNMSAWDEDTPSEVRGLLYYGLDDFLTQYEVPYEGEHILYCYPNSTDQPTRLVVEATLNGRIWYYPVTIEGIESNHSYGIGLTITGAGAASPDSDPQIADFQFSVEVADWKTKTILQNI